MSGLRAVQKQSLADVIQNRCQACNFIKKRLQHWCFLMKFTKFSKTLCYRTSLLCWLLLEVDSVNQWKHALNVYTAEKDMIYLNCTFKASILDKEYSSKVFRTLLAVPNFSKVPVVEVFCKKGALEKFANHGCFSVNFARFSRTGLS